MTDYLPQKTIAYKTYVKATLVSALQAVFKNHPDELLQHTHVSVEYPRTQAEYPAVVVRFYERDISNAGIGHLEFIKIDGETTPSSEVDIAVQGPNSAVRLTWDSVAGATKYRVYKANLPGVFDSYVETTSTEYFDSGTGKRITAALPTINTASFENPQSALGVASPGGFLLPTTYRYRVTAVAPTQVWKFQHSFYTGDLEFAMYGLTSYDRDLVADTIIQVLRMGDLEAYTNRFFLQVFGDRLEGVETTNVHIVNFNRDLVQGFGESQANVVWGQEDAMVYTTSYRCKLWGEFYSLPPKIPFGVVKSVILEPYLTDIEAVPDGLPDNALPWE